MSKIRVLPEQLANQIAAGEVVERPASVVKELLENSLDAGATRIEVEIEGSGTRLIRLIDNGEGMDEDDILLCLERHGTSKIRNEEDLEAISSLGFRGEAIPSIGSVSILSITSRTKDSELGYKVELKYGKLVKSHEQGCRVGTIIEIRNLFGNTPARKKFLRTARTEQNHIDEVIKNYSLVAPDVSFELRIDGRSTISLGSGQKLSQRLAKIMRYENDFLPIASKEDDGEVRGLLVAPEKVTLGPARMRVFVNGRAIKDRMIIHATAEGMRGFLMKGKNPAGLISLTLPAVDIDVNVHPAKHEVRFRNSQGVHGLVQRAVTKAMHDAQQHLQNDLFGGPKVSDNDVSEREIPLAPREIQSIEGEAVALFDTPPNIPIATPYTKLTDKALGITEKEVVEFYTHPQAAVLQGELPSQKPPTSATAPQMREVYSEPKIATSSMSSTSVRLPNGVDDSVCSHDNSATTDAPPRHGLRILGQVGNLYIFCQSYDGIIVIDQHAAHERLLYEKLKKNFSENSMVKQNLLFPETVELSLFQASLVEKHLEDIERMGFSLREFGGDSYVISAIPALAGQMAPQKIFFDILEQFGSDGQARKDAGDMLDTVLATMACRAAVKAGTGLSHKEIESLLDEMAVADLFSHCPHGRPVVKQFSSDDIKKWFYRT